VAKNRKKPQPVQMREDDGNVIVVPLRRPKLRARIPPCQRFHTRDRDLQKGHSRRYKHKGKRGW